MLIISKFIILHFYSADNYDSETILYALLNFLSTASSRYYISYLGLFIQFNLFSIVIYLKILIKFIFLKIYYR